MNSAEIPEKPIFQRHFHVETTEPQDLFLMSEQRRMVFSGRAYLALAPLLDGHHTVSDLIAALQGTLSIPEIFFVLHNLAENDVLANGVSGLAEAEVAFWHAQNVDALTASQRLQQARVGIRVIGAVDPAPLRQMLGTGQERVQIVEVGSDFDIVLTDHYLSPELEAANARALAQNKPWMVVKPMGHTIWIGPIFKPDKTGCWACLAERLRLNRQVDDFIGRKKGYAGPLPTSRATLASTARLGAAWAATELVKWIAQTPQNLEGSLLTLNTLTLEANRHTLVRRPQCPVCGDPERFNKPRPVRLSPARKKFTADGGHRSASPEETFKRFQHHISPITGVVSWLHHIPEQGNGLMYSYTAGHNFVMGLDDMYWLQRSLRSTTGGKGMSEIQAKVSALGEAIERYSGVYRGDEMAVQASYRDLGDEAIHLGHCINYSSRQYATREAWNSSQRSIFHKVPNPFDETAEIDWTPVWSLTNGAFRYFPSSFCYYGHPDSRRYYFCAGNTNGCAAGNTLEEAILQAFLELVERDSVAIWWYNRLQRPAVDTDGFNLAYLKELKAYYDSIHREFWVIDLTTDLKIPTFAAISRRTDQPVEDVIFGFGSHLESRVALLRAVTEMNQFLPAVMRTDQSGRTIYAWPENEAICWWKNETIQSQPYLVPDAVAPVKGCNDYLDLHSNDLREDIHTCVDLTRKLGLEMFVQDQTRPDIGMHVCRVIVPGLRHFWRRLGPGRLYDVPVQLGWRKEPNREETLNPISVFI